MEKQDEMTELKFTLTEDKNWKRTLKVEAPPARVDGHVEKFLSEYQAGAEIPGFRKGKAPLSIIRQKYLGNATQDAVSEAVDELYREFLEKEEKIFPITRPTVTELNYDPGTGLSFTAHFEVKPEIELKKYKGLGLKRSVRKIKDEEVEQAIEHLRNQAGEWSSVNREAKEGPPPSGYFAAEVAPVSFTVGTLTTKASRRLPPRFVVQMKYLPVTSRLPFGNCS